ncbi:hypothetical protein [Streptomyces cinerochromogenes]|uniref:hypothetical protein n=1 Tax=Streptomyces cinerochromogenes TaxID=66422 RepID=UPI00166FE68B|nr:hypothetical protein [Streptomyces cinerochromogenes]GGS76918.1 hypothetical protein GCM10010206_44190 [Streptomyces cinerochromogenes]
MRRFAIPALVAVAVLASGGTAAARGAADQPGGRGTVPRAEDYTWADGAHVVIPPGRTGSSEAVCPPGQVPTGGGYNAFDGGVIDLMVRTNSPTSDGWHAVARNTSSTNTIEFWAVAICAPGTQTQAPRPAPLAP